MIETVVLAECLSILKDQFVKDSSMVELLFFFDDNLQFLPISLTIWNLRFCIATFNHPPSISASSLIRRRSDFSSACERGYSAS